MDQITTLFAYIARDADGNEGLAAFFSQEHSMWMPLVGADCDRVASLRDAAEFIAKQSGQTLHLYHFTLRELKETIEPPRQESH